jgi:hypothetical protein
MGVSGFTGAEHLISSVVAQVSGKGQAALGNLTEGFLKLRPAKSELDDEHKQLPSVL